MIRRDEWFDMGEDSFIVILELIIQYICKNQSLWLDIIKRRKEILEFLKNVKLF